MCGRCHGSTSVRGARSSSCVASWRLPLSVSLPLPVSASLRTITRSTCVVRYFNFASRSSVRGTCDAYGVYVASVIRPRDIGVSNFEWASPSRSVPRPIRTGNPAGQATPRLDTPTRPAVRIGCPSPPLARTPSPGRSPPRHSENAWLRGPFAWAEALSATIGSERCPPRLDGDEI